MKTTEELMREVNSLMENPTKCMLESFCEIGREQVEKNLLSRFQKAEFASVAIKCAEEYGWTWQELEKAIDALTMKIRSLKGDSPAKLPF